MAREFENWVLADSRFELVSPRNFSLVCFRLRADNRTNRRLLDRVNDSGRVFLTHTVLDDKFTLRLAIGGASTRLEDVKEAWGAIQDNVQAAVEDMTIHQGSMDESL